MEYIACPEKSDSHAWDADLAARRGQLALEFALCSPNLNEGTLLYMPTTLPGLSVTKSAELLQMQDRKLIPEPLMAEFRQKAIRLEEKPKSYVGAAAIVLVWLATLGLVFWWLWR